MGASDGRGWCREAAQYYYDLGHQDTEVVPEEVRRHVADCTFCQERVRRLGESLAGIDDGPGCAAGPEDRLTIETLGRHLDLLERPVTCAQVKPFLPHLLPPVPTIRVPTPVTVHADRCPACAADLAALQALGLTAEQLGRLGRLYGTPGGRDGTTCRQARSSLAACADLALDDVPAEILDHVSACASCRAEVYRRREASQPAERPDAAGGPAPCCPGLRPADLFDLAVPYGLAPGRDGVQAVAAHVRTCPACREQMQTLHRALYGIAARPDSGVATVYRAAADAEQAEVQEVPACRPMQARIMYQDPPAEGGDCAAGAAREVRRGPVRAGTRSLLKLACAAVVIILVGVQFQHGPTATGLNADDVLRMLEKAPNIHILSFMHDTPEPWREVWIARRVQKLAHKTARERILYDLGAARMKVISSDGQEEIVPLTREECYYVGQNMVNGAAGVLAGISGQTKRQEMTAVPDSAGGPASDLVVYELTDERYAGNDSPVLRRWRVTVDAATGLPHRLECFQKVTWPVEQEWELSDSRVYEYLSERDVLDAIAALFPPRGSADP